MIAPSCFIMPTLIGNSNLVESPVQGSGMSLGSSSHGFDALITRKKRSQSRRELHIGPIDATMFNSAAKPPGTQSFIGRVYEVGLKPKIPQNPAGPRIDPPMSVPTPRTEPRSATRAASPPEDPPDERLIFRGLSVLPWKPVHLVI